MIARLAAQPPGPGAFLALPPERRAPVIGRMRGFLYGITTLPTALMGVLQWMRYRTAGGADPADAGSGA